MMAPKNNHYSPTSSLNDCIATMVGMHNYGDLKFYKEVTKIVGFQVDCHFKEFLEVKWARKMYMHVYKLCSSTKINCHNVANASLKATKQEKMVEEALKEECGVQSLDEHTHKNGLLSTKEYDELTTLKEKLLHCTMKLCSSYGKTGH